MAWTTEQRYKRYEQWTENEIQQIKEKIAASPWRAAYHVEPDTGSAQRPKWFFLF